MIRQSGGKMRKKQLLFVTYYDENFGEGLSYAFNLAKVLNEGITILLIYRRRITERFENLMAAITFAEADEDKAARQIMTESLAKDKKIVPLLKKFTQDGINVDVYTEKTDVLSAIINFFRQKVAVDMVLLSPSVTDNANIKTRELNRFVKTISRPIVTMAKPTL